MNQTVRGWLAGMMLLAALLVCAWPAWGQNAPESGKGPAGSSLEYLDLEGGEGSLPVWREEDSPAPVPKGGEPEHESLAPKKEALSPEKEARDRPPGAAAGAEALGPASDAGLQGGSSEVRQKPAGAGASESVSSAKGREPAREVDSKKILQSDSPEKFLEHHEEIDKDLIRIYRGFYRKP